ncbi:hypothetical protein QC761_0049340 [Podospora bellae-mahoneyi]|uniref:Uncharacterized protein n=1 Tax=Podospora bellae-mahoneyi TaxID=2093777 RepID=A0ABR0FLC3_9PEZI|nr:hypothetical protein QC761_0049340 [Podospora bellae-mahoneyi]
MCGAGSSVQSHLTSSTARNGVEYQSLRLIVRDVIFVVTARLSISEHSRKREKFEYIIKIIGTKPI